MVLLIFLQPIFLAAALYNLCWVRFSTYIVATYRNVSTRLRLRGVRFFECASYPRRQEGLRYQSQVTPLMAVFLIYDLDLIFFFADVLVFEFWS